MYAILKKFGSFSLSKVYSDAREFVVSTLSFEMADVNYLRYLRSIWLTQDGQHYEGSSAFQDFILSKNLQGMSVDRRDLLNNEDEGLANVNAKSQNPNPFTTWTVLSHSFLLSANCNVDHDGNPDPPHCTVYPPMPYDKESRKLLVQFLMKKTEPFIGRRVL